MQGISYKKQSKNDARFLDAWRALETACKEEGPLMVTDLERNLESQSRPDDASMLRMCRMLRNFMVHDGCGFAEPTAAMTGFIEAMEREVRRAKGTVSDGMMTPARYGCVSIGATAAEAGSVAASKKRGDVLVVDGDKKPVGVFGARAMAAALAGASTTVKGLAEKHLLDAVTVIRSDDPARTAPWTKCIVADAKGKCVGVWNADGRWS